MLIHLALPTAELQKAKWTVKGMASVSENLVDLCTARRKSTVGMESQEVEQERVCGAS